MSEASFCRSCGKSLTDEEKAIAGNVYCKACAPVQATSQPFVTTPGIGYGQPGQPVPGLAFALGFIPGVGAIYNGQYVKGLVHAVIFGSLAAGADRGDAENVFGFLMAAFLFYMAFEAYHTAQRRLQGQLVDEFSSLMPRRGAGFPAGPVVLIGLGVMFLLGNLGLLRFDQIFRFWPVGLIVLGAYLLYERIAQPADVDPKPFDGQAGGVGGNGSVGGNDESKHAA